jgi:hypothetical protein
VPLGTKEGAGEGSIDFPRSTHKAISNATAYTRSILLLWLVLPYYSSANTLGIKI